MKSVRSALIAIVLVVNGFVWLLLAYELHEAKLEKEREVATAMENVTLLLDQTITASAQKTDLALREVMEELTASLQHRGHLDEREVDVVLASWRKRLSPVIGIRVTDAAGTISYGAAPRPDASLSYADRDFFVAQRDSNDGRLIVSNPLLDRVSNTWVIAFTRRYEFTDGRFAGVIVAALPVDYFTSLLSGLDLGPHGGALLRDSTAALIVRHPREASATEQMGAKTFSKELADIISSGATAKTYHSMNTADGVERINTYRRLASVPFHLVAGEAAEDYLADWRRSVAKDAALAAIFLLATSSLAWMLWRSVQQTEKASTRCRVLLRHASDGIHILSAEGNLIEASDSFCRMLGYERSEVIGMNVSQWDLKIPVDALARDISEAARQRRVATLETCHRRKDGSTFDVEITTYPVDIDGQTVLYASARDITERKRADEERRIAAVAFESRQGMVVTDASSTVIRVNRTFTELTGYEAAEVVGSKPSLLKSGRHDAEFYAEMWRAIQQEGFWQGEIWNRRKNGETYPEWLTITAVRDAQGIITHYVASFWDITRRIEDETEIRNLAFFDPLTGLANRRLLTDRLRHAFAKSSRSASYGALLYIDLDRFKELNDTLGHAQGDRLLELVADRLTVNVREGDTVARFGGDEFVVLLEDLDVEPERAAETAVAIADKLRAALAVPYRLHATHAEDWQCTSSIGASLFRGHNDRLEAVLARADRALYAAKGAGRNMVRLA